MGKIIMFEVSPIVGQTRRSYLIVSRFTPTTSHNYMSILPLEQYYWDDDPQVSDSGNHELIAIWAIGLVLGMVIMVG